MSRAIFIAGLPGSGKSFYVEKLSKELQAECFDDYKNNAINNSGLFPFSRNFINLIASLRNNRDCIISDVDFCDPNARAEAEMFIRELVEQVDVEWVYFENNPTQCKKNIMLRAQSDTRNVAEILACLEKYKSKYVIPEHANVIKVWR